MRILTSFKKLLSGRDLEQVASELADGLESRVWNLIERRSGMLGRYEIRGYVRARAALALDDELARQTWSVKTIEVVRAMTLIELTGRFQSRLAVQAAQPLRRAA